MAGLAILKHTYDLSDEALCERWVENPYFQFFCGEEFFRHRPGLRSLLTDALAPAHGRGQACGLAAGEPGDGCQNRRPQAVRSRPGRGRTTVQPKAVMFPPTPS
jgi:transposase, IS5 family